MTKTALWLAACSSFALGLGHAGFGREGLLGALVLILLFNTYVYFYADLRLIPQHQGRRVQGQDAWGVSATVIELAQTARIVPPRVIMVDSTAVQIFPIARSWQSGHIVITQGLAERLSHAEMRAALAYAIVAIRRLETVSFSLGAALANAVLRLTSLMDRLWRLLIGIRYEPQAWQSEIFTYGISPLAFLLVRLTVAPSTYQNIDREAANLVGDQELYARTLWKLEHYAKTLPLNTKASLAHLFIVNPLTTKGWCRYFRAQPPTDERIRHLVGYFPV